MMRWMLLAWFVMLGACASNSENSMRQHESTALPTHEWYCVKLIGEGKNKGEFLPCYVKRDDCEATFIVPESMADRLANASGTRPLYASNTSEMTSRGTPVTERRHSARVRASVRKASYRLGDCTLVE